jgi:peptidoglycan-N-acetylglucosamine deacetylase
MPFLKAKPLDMEVFPVVQNFDGTDFVPGISDFLNNPQARANFRREIALFLATDHYRGLMIDFESFPQAGQPGYVALLNELASDLHAKGMKLYVSVQVRNEDFDYKAISAAVDGVVIMNYDEHFPGGTPGPVASQDWFMDNLDSAVEEIPKEKLICAIGNYGYDWVERPKKGKLPRARPIRASPCRKPGSERAMPKKTLITTATRSTRISAIATTITSATMSGFWMRSRR